MKIIKNLIAILVVIFVSYSCTNNKKSEESQVTVTTYNRKFNFPDIPSMLTTPKERGEYLATHYWTKFDFKDTAYIHLPDVTEQAMVNFIDMITNVSPSVADSALTITFRSATAEPKMFNYFWNTFNRYLNDPNSPMRNEDIYIKTCQAVGRLKNIDEAISSNALFKLKMAKKNRIGERAADFAYTIDSGKQSYMSSINSDKLILFFYDPDCETCDHIKKYMRESSVINGLLRNNKLKVLAFYPEDDIRMWKQKSLDIPNTWINAYDKSQKMKQADSYDLRAMPTLYLLDRNKKVLLKDVRVEDIEHFLQNK